MLTSVKYWLWLTERLNPAAAWQVFCHFGSPERAYFSDPGEYRQISDLSPEQQALLTDKSVAAAEAILARCDSRNIRILTFSDTDFPERLRNIEVPPLVLYLRGRMLRFDERAVIAIAGTRRASAYGLQTAFTFARDLTRGGGLVATGIVAGCDENAVRGALAADGPLVCVTAGGVDVPYYDTEPGRQLLEEVAVRGAVLSENPPGTGHKGSLFARRNALLTGLSVGVLCVEAGLRSGTLGVAALGSEQGKDVFAVPANLGTKTALGTNQLLAQGLAYPVLSAADILSRFGYLLPRTQAAGPDFTRWQVLHSAPAAAPAPPQEAGPEPEAQTVPAPEAPLSSEKKVDIPRDSGYIDLLDASDQWSEEERILLKALAAGPRTLEELLAITGASAGAAVGTLTILSVAGAVRALSGGRYQLIPEALG